MTNPSVPALVASSKLATSANPNTNGTGQTTWGTVTGKTATLYAMNTNNGIQAFTVTVPEPSSTALFGIATIALSFFRRPRVALPSRVE
jgi:hypothetical protein